MISGAHVVVYSKNAEADRAFFRDILGFKSVDADGGAEGSHFVRYVREHPLP